MSSRKLLYFAWKAFSFFINYYLVAMGLFSVYSLCAERFTFHSWKAKEPVTNKEQLFEKLDHFFHIANKNLGWRGVYGTLDQGQLKFSTQFSLKNKNEKTPYLLASLSKQFTAEAIYELEKQKKLKVTDTVCSYLPFFCHENLKRITLLNLLNHDSGLPRSPPGFVGFLKSLASHYTLWNQSFDLAEWFSPQIISEKINPQFQYSNYGYLALSAVIEKVTQKTFAQSMKELIFIPHGLNSTQLEESYFSSGHLSFCMTESFCFYPWVGWIHPSKGSFFGAGGIDSNLQDMLQWGKKLLAREDWKLRKGAFSGKRDIHRAGWFQLANSQNKEVHWHNGGTLGHHTEMFLLPKEKKVIVVLSTINAVNDERDQLYRELRQLVLGEPYQLPLPRKWPPKFSLKSIY